MNDPTPDTIASAAAADPSPRIYGLRGEVADALIRFKQRQLAAIDENREEMRGLAAEHSDVWNDPTPYNDDPLLRAAIAALPDRTLLACLPEMARVLIESALDRIGVP